MNTRVRFLWFAAGMSGWCGLSGCTAGEEWSQFGLLPASAPVEALPGGEAPAASAPQVAAPPQATIVQLPASVPAGSIVEVSGASAQPTQTIEAGQMQMPSQPPAIADQAPALGPAELDELVGRIALYPDALVAQILPASTFPIEIVQAARMVRAGEPAAQIDEQGWDPSVKAIAHYPSVLEMMDRDLDWTQRLGQAFLSQPQDLMDSIQRQRSSAQGLGNLVDTPQQQVLAEGQVIRIVPANPEIVYVPVYEPQYVYVSRPWYGSFISFGYGYACGSWLDLDCGWWWHSCYRPGWTWNRWRDHISCDDHRITRFDRDFDHHHGDDRHDHWTRDSRKPITMPGRPIEHAREPKGFSHLDSALASAELVGPPSPQGRPSDGTRGNPRPGSGAKPQPRPLGYGQQSSPGLVGPASPATSRGSTKVTPAPWGRPATAPANGGAPRVQWSPRPSPAPQPSAGSPPMGPADPRATAGGKSPSPVPIKTFRSPTPMPSSPAAASPAAAPKPTPRAAPPSAPPPAKTFRPAPSEAQRPVMGPPAPARPAATPAPSRPAAAPQAPWGLRDSKKNG